MTSSAQRRLRREMRTVQAMIAIYCRGRHGTRRELCADCRELWRYTERRVDRCPFGEDKPTCVNCPVHCYQPVMRERIREVMRYAGPRMPWRHPVLTLFHFLDGRRPPPPLPGARGQGGAQRADAGEPAGGPGHADGDREAARP